MNDRVYVVDVGSLKQGNFAWVSCSGECGERPEQLVQAICDDVTRSNKVSMGFECPLFIPCPADASMLGQARTGERNRAFSAGAGAGSLVTGLVELAWVLRELAAKIPGRIAPTLDSEVFDRGMANLLIWEAFVSGRAKGPDHLSDARVALTEYRRRRASGEPMDDVRGERVLSLAGAVMLWSGLSDDPALLHQSCAVVMVKS